MNKGHMGLVFFPAFDWAITPTHPEREERLLYTRDQIVEEGLMDVPGVVEYKPRLADIKDAERVHIGVPDIRSLITDAHLVSAGGAMTAADAVMRGDVPRAFALVRPPGHHAMRVVHGTRGFCTINIEAIMIEYLRQTYGLHRVAIVDTDVHHGDGTQDIFYHDPETLYISFHQDGRTLYPGSGFTDELGGPNALGATINIPLPPNTTDEGILFVLDNLILPILADFKPELIINSAGQDNHYSDPLASMAFTAQGYAKLTEKLQANIAVLEGGYSIERALPYVNVGIILAMAGLDYSQVAEPDYDPRLSRQSPDITRYIEQLVRHQWDVWQRRDELRRASLAKHGDFYQRQKRIYYDDSGISETQVETVRLCRHCPGYLTIDTESYGPSGVKTAFIGVIPRNACPACARDAADKVAQAKRAGGRQHYYLQDRPQDCLTEL